MAVAFDATSFSKGTSVSSLTWAHTCTGSNRALGVGISWEVTSATLTSVTYNGSACTFVDESSASRRAAVYNLASPSTGANNIVVTFAAGGENTVAGAVSVTGTSGVISNHANNTGSGVALTITCTSATGEIVFTNFVSGNRTYSAATQTEVWATTDTGGSGNMSGEGQYAAGGATVITAVTINAIAGWDAASMSWTVAGSSGPTGVKTWDGVTQSTGVKTYEGLALASTKSVVGVT